MGGGPRIALGALVAALAICAPAEAQQLTKCDSGGSEFARTSKAPLYEIGPEEIHEVPSSLDGVVIEIVVFRPRAGAQQPPERVPVILNATPYHHAASSTDIRRCKPEYVENFVPQGYAVAFVAVRGTGDSGGCMNLFGPQERHDVDQAVTWLGTREWSTGAVGMAGKSYEGGTTWEVAATGNPHLKTIVPVAGVPDVFELMYAGANIDFRGPLLLNDLYYGPTIVTYANGRKPARTVEATACPEYATGNAASAYSSLTGTVDPFGFWAARRYKDRIERNYRGSVFLVQGFSDLNVQPSMQFPWIQRLRRQGTPLKLMLGWWAHSNPDETGGDAQRDDWADILLAWFDRWLRGADVDTGPAVEVQDSAGKWRTATRWPPLRTKRLWLGADGALRTQPDSGSATHVLVPDPVHVQPATLAMPPTPLDAACPVPTCTAFELGPVTAPLRLAGRPTLRLVVTPAAPAGHVTAYLYADDQRIGWGQVDLRFPRDTEASSQVIPGTPMKLRMRLQPLDSVVAAGQKLTLVISQGAAYNRIPSIPTAPVVLRTGGRAGSLSFPSPR